MRTSYAEEKFCRLQKIAVFATLLCALAAPVSRGEMKAPGSLFIKCDTFLYGIDSAGKNLHFIDKSTGKDYYNRSAGGDWQHCAFVKKDGKTFPVSSAAMADGLLNLRFDGADATASIRVINERDRVVLEIQEVTGDPESITFLNIPLTLEARPSEPFAACALSLNLFTHVHQLPALQTELWATCYKRFGYKGGRVAVIGVPQKSIIPVIRKVMTAAAPDIPFNDQGGAWALDAKEGRGSYLMNFGSLTEETVDQWIENCQRIGFTQIDNHGGGESFFLFGSMELNKQRFPEGWQTFKKIVDKLHRAGISSILHTYACYIGPQSKYVTPVPHPGLDTVATFTLAKPLSVDATEIEVNESTAKALGRDVTLRIGDEIIGFSGVTQTAPFRFTGCTRGHHKTVAAAHAAGAKASILKTFWGGLYVPNPDSPLFNEVAQNTADVVNECGFDGIYFDAIEGIQHMWGQENYWYYGGRFVFEVAKRLKKPVGMEYAGMMHSWWHYRSRYQAWDSPARGYKRFLDIHIASMNAGEEYQHGAWTGHRPKIDKYAPMNENALYLPFQFGWWRFHVWGGAQSEPTFADDVEYYCCKMIGHNAGLSLNGDIGESMLNSYPVFRDYVSMVKQYEELRHANYFGESVRKQLRQVEKDFTLFRGQDGKWNFKPVAYNAHMVRGLRHPTAQWAVQNDYAEQPVKLRIEPMLSAGLVNSPEPFLLLDPAKADEVKVARMAAGVTCSAQPSSIAVPATGEPAIEVSALSTGAVPIEGSWVSIRRTFPAATNLWGREAIGVWVHGDGNGELLNFKVGGSHHYVTVDFTGWNYFELVEAESTRARDYIWPEGNVYTYFTDWGHKGYKTAQNFELWLNNLPANKRVNARIGPVKALDLVEKTVKNPAVHVNGAAVTFPVEMSTGMYLEMKSGAECNLYNKAGKIIQKVTPQGGVPVLKQGKNAISFTGESAGPDETRVRVTVIAEGAPLQ